MMAVTDIASLSIRLVTESEDEPRLVVAGSLGMGTAPELEAALAAELAERSQVLLDLSELTFMDSCGVRVIVSSLKLAELHGWSFRIRDELPGQVRRLLHVTGIAPFLPMAA
jgi:anti-sigma B factor antagonist